MKNILKLLFAFTLLCFAFNVDAQRLKIGKQLQKCKDANGNPIADCIVVTDSLGNQTYAPLSNFCDACNFGGMSKAIQDFTVTEDSIITIVDVFGNTFIDTIRYPNQTFMETITTLVNTLNMGTLIGTYTSEDGISIPLYSPSYDLALDTDSSLVFTSTNGVNQTIDLKEIIETCILNTPSPTTTTVTILQNVQGLHSVIINVNGTNYIFEDTNLIETVTTITPLQAVGTPIATYTNEDGTITTIYSPVNSLTLSTDTSLVFTSSVGGAPQIIDLKSIIEQCIDDNATDVVVDLLTSVNGLDSVIITVDGVPFEFKDTNTISTFTDGTTATGISTTHDNGDGVTHVISIDTVKNSDGTTTINYILGGNSLSVGVCTDCPTLDSLHSNVMYITNVNGDTTGFTITKTNNDGSTSDVTINLPSAQDIEYNFDETTYPDSVCLVVNGVLQDCFPKGDTSIQVPSGGCTFADPDNPTSAEIESCIASYIAANNPNCPTMLFFVGDGTTTNPDYAYWYDCENSIEIESPSLSTCELVVPDNDTTYIAGGFRNVVDYFANGKCELDSIVYCKSLCDLAILGEIDVCGTVGGIDTLDCDLGGWTNGKECQNGTSPFNSVDDRCEELDVMLLDMSVNYAVVAYEGCEFNNVAAGADCTNADLDAGNIFHPDLYNVRSVIRQHTGLANSCTANATVINVTSTSAIGTPTCVLPSSSTQSTLIESLYPVSDLYGNPGLPTGGANDYYLPTNSSSEFYGSCTGSSLSIGENLTNACGLMATNRTERVLIDGWLVFQGNSAGVVDLRVRSANGNYFAIAVSDNYEESNLKFIGEISKSNINAEVLFQINVPDTDVSDCALNV